MKRRTMLKSVSLAASLSLPPTVLAAGKASSGDIPETVAFPSADGKTNLVGYLFTSATVQRKRVPGVILMHGRAGPYSSLAKGRFDATTISQRHLAWGRLWADKGGVALLVDSFAPRGYPTGFKAGTYDDRPGEIDEIAVRPLDAYGARTYLSHRPEVDALKLGLQGWSNGGSAVLAAMAGETLRKLGLTRSEGFRAALAFYPGCGLQGQFDAGYAPYAPVRILIGTADEEVSPRKCENLVRQSRSKGHDIDLVVYADATHDFDDPGRRRQSVVPNANAYASASLLAARFMGEHIGI